MSWGMEVSVGCEDVCGVWGVCWAVWGVNMSVVYLWVVGYLWDEGMSGMWRV